ncbi:MAG: glutamate-1-semialdehyde 2,1-aminomutase [Luteibaculum sp.]
MFNTSASLFEEAQSYFPGGVNSPVRAFKSVGGTPVFIESGKGAEVRDEDGNTYIDFCCSWGPLILGHAPDAVLSEVSKALAKGTSFGTPTRAENLLGSFILDRNKYIDRIRFVSSGTEAVMSAIRLARGYTGRNKIIKFEGCYHGHVDSLMVNAGSGLATLGTASSKGIPTSVIEDTVVIPLDDIEAAKQAFAAHKDQIACAIIEPVPANNGLLKQRKEYLESLKALCHENCALLIFDEVISGFRVGFDGAAGLYDIQPDLITYGKIIGGGFPVGAYAGKRHIMEYIAPLGGVYQAGTLSGNPIAMTAGLAQLRECAAEGFYEDQEKRTQFFVDRINAFAKEKAYDFHLTSLGSIFWCVFGNKEIRKASEIDSSKMPHFAKLFHALLKEGIYMGPSGYEVGFISAAHTEEILIRAAEKFTSALEQTFR